MGTWILLAWLAASIEGRLWNPVTGSPVRKADVVVGTVTGAPVMRAVSDLNGHYSVQGLRAGRYRVAAGHAGFVPSLSSLVLVLKEDEHRTAVDIAMNTPAVIQGHVFDGEGEPVENVPVIAATRDEVSGAVSIAGIVKTNDLGEYRFSGLLAGTYVLRASSSNAPLGQVYTSSYYPESSEWDNASPVRVALGGEARDIDIRVRMNQAGSISGLVRGPGPVRVVISRKSSDAVMLAVTEADRTLAADGRFLFQQLSPGTYVIRAEAGGLWGKADVQVNGAEAHTEIDLHPAGVLKLELNTPANMLLTRGNQYRVIAKRGEKGELFFEGVTPGSWFLQTDSLPEGSFVESVQWGKQEVYGRAFELGEQPWPALRVRINPNGATLEGEAGSVSLLPEAGGKPIYAIAGEDGRFRVRGIRPGKYRLECSGELLDLAAGALVKRDCK